MMRLVSAVFTGDIAATAAGVAARLTAMNLPPAAGLVVATDATSVQPQRPGRWIGARCTVNLDSAVALDTPAGTEAWQQAIEAVQVVFSSGGKVVLSMKLSTLLGGPNVASSSGAAATSLGFYVGGGAGMARLDWSVAKDEAVYVEAHNLEATGVAIQGLQFEVVGEF